MKIRTIFKNLKKDQIIAIISGTLNIISMMLTAILIQRVFDSFSGGNYNDVKENSLYFLILLGLNIIFNYIFQYYYRLIEYTGSFPLRKFLLNNFLKSDYETSAKFKKGEMITAITDDSLKISEVYATGFIQMIIEAIQFLSCLIIISYYNVFIGIFCLSMVIIGIFLTKKISIKIGEDTSSLQVKTANEQSKLLEILEGLRVIKQLKKEDYFFEIYKNSLRQKQDISKSLSKNFALYADIYTFISNILPLLTILISIFFMINGKMSLGAAIGIYSIVGALTEPISLFSNFLNNYRIATKIIEKDKKLFELEHKEDHLSLESLNNLNFSSKGYNFGEKRVLNDVQFTINKGEIIVIKGESGVGKSTIFNFINKFIVSDDVDVFFNGINTKDIPSSSLFDKIKETGQKSITINDTIIENIVLGEKFSKDEIDEVIKMCQLENLIRLKGEDFIVNESADNLSGGEKQRISLARVLIRKPDVILLDEPTSALDENTAENFISAFYEFIKKYEMSAIVITHKNDFVKISDMIVDLK